MKIFESFFLELSLENLFNVASPTMVGMQLVSDNENNSDIEILKFYEPLKISSNLYVLLLKYYLKFVYF